MTEKPMVTSSEHAYDLWRLVKKSGKLFAIAFQSSYSAEFGYLAPSEIAGRWGRCR